METMIFIPTSCMGIPDTHNIPGGIPLCDLFSISDYVILPIE